MSLFPAWNLPVMSSWSWLFLQTASFRQFVFLSLLVLFFLSTHGTVFSFPINILLLFLPTVNCLRLVTVFGNQGAPSWSPGLILLFFPFFKTLHLSHIFSLVHFFNPTNTTIQHPHWLTYYLPSDLIHCWFSPSSNTIVLLFFS